MIYCALNKRQNRKLKYESEWKARKALAQVMSRSKKKKTAGVGGVVGGGKLTSHNNETSLKKPLALKTGKSGRLIKVAQAVAKTNKNVDAASIGVNSNHTNHTNKTVI